MYEMWVGSCWFGGLSKRHIHIIYTCFGVDTNCRSWFTERDTVTSADAAECAEYLNQIGVFFPLKIWGTAVSCESLWPDDVHPRVSFRLVNAVLISSNFWQTVSDFVFQDFKKTQKLFWHSGVYFCQNTSDFWFLQLYSFYMFRDGWEKCIVTCNI